MSNIRIPRGWQRVAGRATPEDVYLRRREILARLGIGAGALLAGGSLLSPLGCSSDGDAAGDGGARDARIWTDGTAPGWYRRHAGLYPVDRNKRYTVPERGVTPEKLSTGYNNFYEFTTDKKGVRALAQHYTTYPWTVKISGKVSKPMTLDFDKLVRMMSLEERLYRHRCVEAWSMTVPWSGFPFTALTKLVQPLSSAKYVRMVSALHKDEMPGTGPSFYPWPYHEGLRMDEAQNELTFLVTGLYDKPVPPQNGAPLRLVVPWKYGYKSIKSIVEIEFVEKQPKTFWSTMQPKEYPFESNVDPDVPHPRWSQKTETLLDTGKKIPTKKYNGYGDYVAKLYS